MRTLLLHIKHFIWETWKRLGKGVGAYYKKCLWISVILGSAGTAFISTPTLFDLLGQKGKYATIFITAFNFGIAYLSRTTLTPTEYAELMAKKNELKARENA